MADPSPAASGTPPGYTPRPWAPLFGVDRQFCGKVHAPVPGWPEGPLSHEHELATVVEGYCPLCPGLRLEGRQPWADLPPAYATDEVWAHCDCCDLLYHVTDSAVGPSLETTGGMGTSVMEPSGVIY